MFKDLHLVIISVAVVASIFLGYREIKRLQSKIKDLEKDVSVLNHRASPFYHNHNDNYLNNNLASQLEDTNHYNSSDRQVNTTQSKNKGTPILREDFKPLNNDESSIEESLEINSIESELIQKVGNLTPTFHDDSIIENNTSLGGNVPANEEMNNPVTINDPMITSLNELDKVSDRESNQELDMESNVELDRESNGESDRESNVELDRESNVELDRESNVESDRESNVESDKESNVESDRESNIELDKESNGNSDMESNVELDKESNEESDKESNGELTNKFDNAFTNDVMEGQDSIVLTNDSRLNDNNQVYHLETPSEINKGTSVEDEISEKVDASMFQEKNLNTMTIKELKILADSRGIYTKSRPKKQELVDRLIQYSTETNTMTSKI